MPAKSLILLLLVVLPLGVLRADPSPEAKATVVIYNTSTPGDTSHLLAQYYAQRRGIPGDHLIGLACPVQEEISRDDYNSTIAGPLRKIFLARGWWQKLGSTIDSTQIRFVALMRGMPLKIRPTARPPNAPPLQALEHDEASVDSELACLGLNIPTVVGVAPNPYAGRNSPIVDSMVDPGLLLVCRLDAPTDLMVRVMIDDSLMAEKSGLWGWAYVDSRGLQPGNPYYEGDGWMKNIVQELRARGVPVLMDKLPETLPDGYPVTDAAIYYGWYAWNVTGPFTDFAMRFRPGAVAVHIHSFSASSLRDPAALWCAPLINRGAAATLGNVYEPGLTLTAHLDIFQDRLMAGNTFAESAYMALLGLSWMNVSIGDPLYRPYAAWQHTDGQNDNPWALYRQIVCSAGSIINAGPELVQAARQTGQTFFLESLAAAQADSGDLKGALRTLNLAIPMEKRPRVAFRLVWEKLGILQATGAKDELKALLMSQLAASPAPPQKALLTQALNRYFPQPPPPSAPPAPKK